MTDDWLEARYEKDPNIVYREIAGEAILVPIRKQTADEAAIYVLNETGARIWELLDGERTLRDVLDTLSQEYDVDADTAEGDLVQMIGQLQALGMVQAGSNAVY